MHDSQTSAGTYGAWKTFLLEPAANPAPYPLKRSSHVFVYQSAHSAAGLPDPIYLSVTPILQTVLKILRGSLARELSDERDEPKQRTFIWHLVADLATRFLGKRVEVRLSVGKRPRDVLE